MSAARAGSRVSTSKTWEAGRRSRSWSAPSEWTPIRLMFAQTLLAPDSARIAAAARHERPHRDALAHLQPRRTVRADDFDDTGGLVSLDPRVALESELPEEVVEVRAADADSLGPDDHLAGARLARLLDVHDLHAASALRDDREHGAVSPPLPRRPGPGHP